MLLALLQCIYLEANFLLQILGRYSLQVTVNGFLLFWFRKISVAQICSECCECGLLGFVCLVRFCFSECLEVFYCFLMTKLLHYASCKFTIKNQEV